MFTKYHYTLLIIIVFLLIIAVYVTNNSKKLKSKQIDIKDTKEDDNIQDILFPDQSTRIDYVTNNFNKTKQSYENFVNGIQSYVNPYEKISNIYTTYGYNKLRNLFNL